MTTDDGAEAPEGGLGTSFSHEVADGVHRFRTAPGAGPGADAELADVLARIITAGRQPRCPDPSRD